MIDRSGWTTLVVKLAVKDVWIISRRFDTAADAEKARAYLERNGRMGGLDAQCVPWQPSHVPGRVWTAPAVEAPTSSRGRISRALFQERSTDGKR